MKNKNTSQILYQTKAKRGIGYYIDLFCAVRIGKKAPKFYQKRGHKMAVFANDYVGILINQFGLYERDELDLLFEFLTPLKECFSSGTALDIGANIGNHSVFFSTYFSQVHSFEPSPDTYYLLHYNAKQRENITAHNMGLGDLSGQFHMVENHTNIGGTYIDTADNDQDRGETISVQKMDELSIDLDALTFMKIDVEGFEERVIKGGIESIKKHQPLIVFEQAEQEFMDGSTPSIEVLKSLGYCFCWQNKQKVSRFWLIRRLANLFQATVGFKPMIVTGPVVPKQFHSMLIAVPARFKSLLNIE